MLCKAVDRGFPALHASLAEREAPGRTWTLAAMTACAAAAMPRLSSLPDKPARNACAGSLPAHSARLIYGGRSLEADASLASCGLAPGATLHLTGRLRGGAPLTVHPRLQRERWSLYWKETMATTTDLLDDLALDLDPVTATPADVLAAAAAALGWAPADSLLALEGFEGPWERVLYRGRELELGKTLQEQGVPSGADLTAVRLALVAEGWKASSPGFFMFCRRDDCLGC